MSINGGVDELGSERIPDLRIEPCRIHDHTFTEPGDRPYDLPVGHLASALRPSTVAFCDIACQLIRLMRCHKRVIYAICVPYGRIQQWR